MDNKAYVESLNNGNNFYNIIQFATDNGVDIRTLPYSIRVLLENVLRKANADEVKTKGLEILNWQANLGADVAFYPARILLQDYTGVPCVVDIASMRDAAAELGLDPESINPEIPVDLVIDHSVQVDQAGTPAALAYNIKKEFERNSERYQLLKWAQKSFNNFRAIPPDTGIVHQVNIEYLSPVVQSINGIEYPDSVFGTDSHTTMVNALGVLGWGVGGIEAEACMLGESSVFSIPEVIGVKFINQLPSGVVATDLALKVTQVLRDNQVVGKFVEYFGPGYETLPLADRATLSNMAPEYGSTCGFFPIDQETLNYLRLTNRDEADIARVKEYSEANGLYYSAADADKIQYSSVIEIDLAEISTSLSGPKRPQDLIKLEDMAQSFDKAIVSPSGHSGFGLTEADLEASYDFELDGQTDALNTGDVLIAAITSCTNTSNPVVLIGAGLLARNAVEKGLTVSPKVKTSFAPGSQAVSQYLIDSGLSPYLDQLGFQVVGYGCTTCIGNSGPLNPAIEKALIDSDLVGAAVLSGNRNFESRIHPLIKANYLASPLLVIAYAIAGTVRKDLQKDPLGYTADGEAIYLSDIWPSSSEINSVVKEYISSETYREAYENIFQGTAEWDKLDADASATFPWDEESTYIANPPYFDEQIAGKIELAKLKNMRTLAKVGSSITTDHISPAGNIALKSPAADYLRSKEIESINFNSYGSRRGHHDVMTRGTLANTRLNNELADGKLGGFTKYLPTGEIMSIFEASQAYQEAGTELVILAGKDYGMGSSRDWAGKGVKLLGVKAVIAESYERIHRSNLVMMGLVPMEYVNGENAESLGLTGEEIFDIDLPEDVKPRQHIRVTATHPETGKQTEFETLVRFDSDVEIGFYEMGGILNRVLQDKVEALA